MQRHRRAWTLLIALVSSGAGSACAGVKFYSDGTLKTETGVRFHEPKPHLLVQRTGAKDKPVEMSIVYLPDPSQATYAVAKRGMGSSKLTLKMQNGMLTDVGAESDAKVPETIAAMAGMLTSAATAYKTVQEGKGLREEALDTQAREAAVASIRAIAASIEAGLKRFGAAIVGDTTLRAQAVAADLKAQADLLDSDEGEVLAGAVAAALKGIATRIEKLAQAAPADPQSAVHTWNSQIGTLALQAVATASTLAAPAAKAEEFELYEIRTVNGQTVLSKVKLGA
jgi:hypothetical protein